MRPISILILLVIASFWSGPVAGQDLLGRWRTQNRAPEGNRYEGPVPLLVSAERIEILSFTRNAPKTWHDTNLHVRLYQPADRRVVIVARDVDDSYRMESSTKFSAGWNLFSPWPTAYRLENMKIEAEDLGVVAYVTLDGRVPPPPPLTLVPVDVVSAGGGTQAGNAYVARLRSNVPLRAPEWQIRDEKNAVVLASDSISQEERPVGGIREKEPFQLNIPRGKLPAPGKFELFLKAQAWSTSQSFDFSVWFYHLEPWGK
jgi:hypothetical protein